MRAFSAIPGNHIAALFGACLVLRVSHRRIRDGGRLSTDRYIESNGILVHIVDHNEDEGPVLVLAPGLTANSRVFDCLVHHRLAPAMRVLAFDMRGRGEPDKSDDGYTLDDRFVGNL